MNALYIQLLSYIIFSITVYEILITLHVHFKRLIFSLMFIHFYEYLNSYIRNFPAWNKSCKMLLHLKLTTSFK